MWTTGNEAMSASDQEREGSSCELPMWSTTRNNVTVRLCTASGHPAAASLEHPEGPTLPSGISHRDAFNSLGTFANPLLTQASSSEHLRSDRTSWNRELQFVPARKITRYRLHPVSGEGPRDYLSRRQTSSAQLDLEDTIKFAVDELQLPRFAADHSVAPSRTDHQPRIGESSEQCDHSPVPVLREDSLSKTEVSTAFTNAYITGT